MVKIAHISDIHWRGIQRHDEYTKAIELLFEQLREEKPDLIINTGDTYHTKTAGLTPEIIQKLSWTFNGLAKIADVYTILGQHDGNLRNPNRQNIIAPIHKAINNPKATLFQKSRTYKIEEHKIALGVFSMFDRSGWGRVKPEKGYINIALFHGFITGCKMENSREVSKGEKDVDFFEKFDFALLGDVHKHQFLATRKDKDGIEKPWMGYPGSLIQQDHGESIKKGYLVWNIESKNSWDVSWKKLTNMAPFVTIPWLDSTQATLENFEKKHGSYAYMPGTRYRIRSATGIPQIQANEITEKLKEEHGAFNVIFSANKVSKMDSVSAHGVKFSKKSLSQDADAIISLYNKYVEAHQDTYSFGATDQETAANTIKSYVQRLTQGSENQVKKNVLWSVKGLEFDNLYAFGEGNTIDFEKLKNTVGIFGKNRIGKSSIIGALMYTLYNTTDRGPAKNARIINNNKDSCYGMARITVGGIDYIIERKTERTKEKKKKKKKESRPEEKSSTTVNLWRIDFDENGEEVPVSKNGITRDDTDRIIRNLIGNSEDFLLTALARQGKINQFIENKATKRKEVLNRFLDLDVF